jgi:hypothetical protein
MEGKGGHVEADPGHDVVEGESNAADVASDSATCGCDEVNQGLEADDNGSDAK